METYKNLRKRFIGYSDIASLTIRSCDKVAALDFAYEGSYYAYVVEGEVEIPPQYVPVFDGSFWLKIFDDSELAFRFYGRAYSKVTVYRAGETGCIIHWHS